MLFAKPHSIHVFWLFPMVRFSLKEYRMSHILITFGPPFKGEVHIFDAFSAVLFLNFYRQ